MPVKLVRDLLVGAPFNVEPQHFNLKAGQHLTEAYHYALGLLATYNDITRIERSVGEEIYEVPVRIVRVIQRVVQRNIRIKRRVLLSRGCLDCGDYLPGDADLGESLEGRITVAPVIADSLIKADHPLLHDVLPVRADQKVGARLHAYEHLVSLQHGHKCLGVLRLCQLHQVRIAFLGILSTTFICQLNNPIQGPSLLPFNVLYYRLTYI